MFPSQVNGGWSSINVKYVYLQLFYLLIVSFVACYFLQCTVSELDLCHSNTSYLSLTKHRNEISEYSTKDFTFICICFMMTSELRTFGYLNTRWSPGVRINEVSLQLKTFLVVIQVIIMVIVYYNTL